MSFAVELFQDRLFLRERFARGFVRFIGGQPDLVPQRNRIVVERKQRVAANALAEIAVLFGVAEANHHAQQAHWDSLVFPLGPTRPFVGEVFYSPAAIST